MMSGVCDPCAPLDPATLDFAGSADAFFDIRARSISLGSSRLGLGTDARKEPTVDPPAAELQSYELSCTDRTLCGSLEAGVVLRKFESEGCSRAEERGLTGRGQCIDAQLGNDLQTKRRPDIRAACSAKLLCRPCVFNSGVIHLVALCRCLC